MEGHVSSKRSGEPLRKPRRLRSFRKTGGLRRRPQQRLHQLVALGRRARHPHAEGADAALYLFWIERHRRRRASSEGWPVAVARRPILECLLLERDRRPEILAKRDARA